MDPVNAWIAARNGKLRNDRMSLFCHLTPSHLRMFDEFMAPSFCEEFDLVPFVRPQIGTGEPGNRHWEAAIRQKVDSMILACERSPNKPFVWSDADVQGFGFCHDILIDFLGGHDIALMQGVAGDRCSTAFFIARPSVKWAFEKMLWGTYKTNKADEDIFNLLKHELNWRMLPPSLFWEARWKMIGYDGIPNGLLVNHAGNFDKINDKVRWLTEVRSYVIANKKGRKR